MRHKILLTTALAIVLGGVAAAQLRLPDPTEALSSPGMEKMAGILFSRRLEEGFGLASRILPPDDPQVLRVQSIVGRLAQAVALDQPGVVFQVKVIDSGEVNAFCIPGGFIYVYTGLIKHLDSHHKDAPDDALAVVLGHEIAHAALRHGLKDWAASKDFREVLKDQETFQKTLLACSRTQELEADRYGALYATRAGYRFTIAIDVFRAFPDYRHIFNADDPTTHPTGPERVAQLEKFHKQLKTMVGLWDESLLAQEAERLDQAAIALEILQAEFPNLPSVHNNLGWVYFRVYEKSDPQPSPELTSYAYVRDLGIKVRGASGDTLTLREAQEEFRLALSLNPDMVEAREGSALCLLELGDIAAAEEMLKTAASLAPDRAETKNLLGVVAARRGQREEAAALYQAATAARKDFAPAYFNLALVSEGPSRQRALEQFLALSPSGSWAAKAQAMLGAQTAVSSANPPAEMAGVKLGSSEEIVLRSLGTPTARTRLPSDTVALEFGGAKPRVWLRGNEGVSAIEVASGEFAGVRVGDSSSTLKSVLGEPSAKRPPVDGSEAWRYPDLGLTVLLRQNEVVSLRLAR
jgi:predicted Zn-dependent protease